jgi:hypothetical protein
VHHQAFADSLPHDCNSFFKNFRTVIRAPARNADAR